MSHDAWTAAFFGTALLLLIVPASPALIEWRRKSDAHPLKIQRGRQSSSWFAEGFRIFILRRFANTIDRVGDSGQFHGAMSDGTRYSVLGSTVALMLDAAEMASGVVERLVVARADLALPDATLFVGDIYSGTHIRTGSRSAFRAMFAEGSIELGDACQVVRWAHAGARIAFGASARITGRITAGDHVELRGNSEFLHLAAPTIDLGKFEARSDPNTSVDSDRCVKLKRPEHLAHSDGQRWIVRGDLEVPRHTFHRGNLIVTGTLFLGDGACVFGSLKAQRIVMGVGVRVDGAVIAVDQIIARQDAMLLGPVISEGDMQLGSGARIGRLTRPASLVAQRLVANEPVRIHGTVRLRERGELTSGGLT